MPESNGSGASVQVEANSQGCTGPAAVHLTWSPAQILAGEIAANHARIRIREAWRIFSKCERQGRVTPKARFGHAHPRPREIVKAPVGSEWRTSKPGGCAAGVGGAVSVSKTFCHRRSLRRQ